MLTALLIPAIGCGLHPRLRRIAGLQGLLLITGLGLAVSTIAWKGLHDLDFPVANFSLYGGIALIVALLHPQRRRLFAGGSFEPKLAIMFGFAAVPLLVYAVDQALKQQAGADPVHSAAGHFALTAALAVALLADAGLATLRTDGWRLPLWSAGLGVAALGAGGVALSSESSSFGLVGGIAALAWGAAFISVGTRSAEKQPAS